MKKNHITNFMFDKIADAAQISEATLSSYVSILRRELKIKAPNQAYHI